MSRQRTISHAKQTHFSYINIGRYVNHARNFGAFTAYEQSSKIINLLPLKNILRHMSRHTGFILFFRWGGGDRVPTITKRFYFYQNTSNVKCGVVAWELTNLLNHFGDEMMLFCQNMWNIFMRFPVCGGFKISGPKMIETEVIKVSL